MQKKVDDDYNLIQKNFLNIFVLDIYFALFIRYFQIFCIFLNDGIDFKINKKMDYFSQAAERIGIPTSDLATTTTTMTATVIHAENIDSDSVLSSVK